MTLAIVKTNIQQFDHHLCRIFFLQEFLLSISPDLLHMKVKWQQIKAVCRMSKNLQRVLSLVLTTFKDCSMKYYVQNKLQHRHSSCDSKYLKDIFFLGKNCIMVHWAHLEESTHAFHKKEITVLAHSYLGNDTLTYSHLHLQHHCINMSLELLHHKDYNACFIWTTSIK